MADRRARRALDAGVRSSLSVALPLQQAVVGALNIYATQPATFDPDAIELARAFAGYAAVAHLYQTTATLGENMRRAMETPRRHRASRGHPRRPAALHPRAGIRTAHPPLPDHPPQTPRLRHRPRHHHDQ